MKKLWLVVLNFNVVSVTLYEIEEDELKTLSNELDSEDTEELVLEFMYRRGHRESECNWMFSENPIELYDERE